MRKLLLGTTAVVGAALLSTGASAQEAPTVRIGGYMDFSYTFLSDTADRGTQTFSPTARRPRTSDFRSDMEVHVLVSGKTAGGITYGARIEFQNDNIPGSGQTAVDTDETWLFVSSPTLGTVRFGDTDAAAFVMQVRPPRYPAFYRPSWYVARPGGFNYVNSGLTDGSDITKITYMSPQFAGFDFGVSYAVNGNEGPRNNNGTTTGLIDRDRQGRQNEITAAIRYRGNFSGVGVAAGFAMTHAESGANQRAAASLVNAGARNTITSYGAGLTASFQGFTFGGEYVFGNYRGASVGTAPTARGADMSWHYLLGASYTFSPVTITANFGQGFQDGRRPTAAATVRDMRHTHVGVGASYTIAPGLLGYISYEYQRFRGWPGSSVGSVAAGGNRTMQALTVGTTLSF
ncbi:porin [Roseococcus suduntuyensis]|uniref:Putative porin n=1 Tax=Roseococcus suduntuyensis TaxID=455361 RepID=A0A840ABQ6_9PROT|nr:porin [Roseococcus suduntuyensis]MBB3897575.1 putative porin [Roseococcus suduntuyensis]